MSPPGRGGNTARAAMGGALSVSPFWVAAEPPLLFRYGGELMNELEYASDAETDEELLSDEEYDALSEEFDLAAEGDYEVPCPDCLQRRIDGHWPWQEETEYA
jgi:hypothetical protein